MGAYRAPISISVASPGQGSHLMTKRNHGDPRSWFIQKEPLGPGPYKALEGLIRPLRDLRAL